MKVKDVVRAAAEALRLTDAVNFCDGKNESDAEKAAAGEAEAKKLLEFFNDTETELAVLAVPLIKDEKVTAVNGEIALSALSENFLRALRLTDKNGRRAAFATGAGALKTDADEGILRYAYLPAKKTLDGESDFRCGVPEKLFVNGVVSRYYFDRQLFEEAAVYKKEYEAAALCVRRLADGGKFRARRWR